MRHNADSLKDYGMKEQQSQPKRRDPARAGLWNSLASHEADIVQ